MLMSQKKDLVKEKMLEITKPLQEKKLEFIKNPMVLEFLGIPENNDFKKAYKNYSQNQFKSIFLFKKILAN